MNKILTYIICILCVGSFCVSCSSDDSLNLEQQGEGVILSLQIENSELKSRATIAESENSIQTLDIYLYPNNGTNKNAVYQYSHVLTNANTTGTETVTVNVPGNAVSTLFANGANTCIAYVIANKGTTELPTVDTSMASLKGTEIETNFTSQPEFFVMDGSATVNYSSEAKTINGTVSLYRAASKISLTVTNVMHTVEDDFGNIWESDPAKEKMMIAFYNGVKKGNIGVTAQPYTIQEEDYFSINGTNGRELKKNADNSKSTHYTHESPFYSYTSAWEASSPKAAYLMVIVPWKQRGKESEGYKLCYYQIPINAATKKLERNHYYKIELNIGILGSFTPDEPKPINDATYVVLDWSEAETSAGLKEYRYLVVDKNFVEMDNVENLSIKFSTSHETEIVNAVLKRPVLNPMNSNDETIASSSYTLETKVVDGQNYIYFSHALDNEWSDTDKNYDYVPYTLELDIRHKDDPNFIEHITIVQYPAMYVVAKQNSAYKAVVTENNKDRNVFVNSYYSNSSNYNSNYANITNYHSVANTQLTQDIFGPATGLYKAKFQNDNPNMYVIHVTAMSDDKYIIGDPREKDVNSSFIGSAKWAEAPALYASSPRNLQYYYLTDVNENTRNMIAPIIRIASSYSVTEDVTTRDIAEKRCASYQEDGYPAGRWRMPTYAEVEFICRMSSEGKIPDLFYKPTSSNGFRIYYWCAHGQFSPNYNGGIDLGSGAETIRCVYDEWYWTDKCDKGTFTWGDREITW